MPTLLGSGPLLARASSSGIIGAIHSHDVASSCGTCPWRV
jgi:hypothetical protein